MAFFRQLQLLLWKNGLAVIRQPVWSLTLIIWPLTIFIIIAVTRSHFPPLVTDTCYVGPRNLPSTGLLPFLQTLMCSTDSSCQNKSLLVDPATSKSSRHKRSANLLKNSPLLNLDLDQVLRSVPPSNDPAAVMKSLKRLLGSYQGRPNSVSPMNANNATHQQDQETMKEMLKSANLLKRVICTLSLPRINTTSPNIFTSAVVTFCKTNHTLVEVLLQVVNQILTEEILTEPDKMVTVVGVAVMLFNQMQNETSLWEALLAIPKLFSSGSVDQALSSAEALLENLPGALHVIQSNFPETEDSFSTVHSLIARGIGLIHYMRNWPGKDVYISLRDVVTLHGGPLNETVKRILQEVKIPLDKAIGLMMDKDKVLHYLCDNGNNQMWLSAACSTGAVDMLLDVISPDKVAKQVLLAWVESVAPYDLDFVKGVIHGGAFSSGGPGGSNSTETWSSEDIEELFLYFGQVGMDLIKTVPEVGVVVQRILTVGFQLMKSATLTLHTVQEIVGNVKKDADQLQLAYNMLLANQSKANIWICRVLDSVMEMINQTMSSEYLTCEDCLGPIEWLIPNNSIKTEVWRSMICQNSSTLQHVLLMDYMHLAEKAQEVYSAITGQADFNVTLPMILSEWHKLCNSSREFGMFLRRLKDEYWMNWMPDNNSFATTPQSAFRFMVSLGEKIEKSPLWPKAKNYFHMAYWILNYRPGVTTPPANCSVTSHSLAIHCDTGLNWTHFVQAMSQALMSPSQDVLVNCLKGTVSLLEYVYGDVYKYLANSYLKQEIKGGDALADHVIKLQDNLYDFIKNISSLPDEDISHPDVIHSLISTLLKSTGLAPLRSVLFSDGPLNVSTVLDLALKLGRLNQHIFTFNETHPAMPELERLMMQFLSLEGTLTVALSHMMGHSLLTYSVYIHPDDIARLKEKIQQYTNQTSAGLVEAILKSMELLNTLHSPNADPTHTILGYIQMIQECIISFFRLPKMDYLLSPSGQLNTATDFLDLLTPETLQNLTQAGPDAAQDIVIQKFLALLPPEVQMKAARFLQDFKALLSQTKECAARQHCLAGISEIFMSLDQILDMVLSANGNVTIEIAVNNSVLHEYKEMTSLFFSLLLSPNDAAYVETFKQTLQFIKVVIAKPNVTMSSVQNALNESNLTVQDLNDIAALAGAANVNQLVVNMMDIVNARRCLEPQKDQMVTAECVKGLINGVSGLLTHLPPFRNDATILSLISLIANKTISDIAKLNFSSNPNMVLLHALASTLANIKMGLQLNHLDTPEIMKEIRVVEGLILLIATSHSTMEPYKNNFNTTMMMNPIYAQKVYLELVEWYLKRLENVTSNSSVSTLLHPFFSVAQMQLTMQLSQTDFSLFVSKKVESLIRSLKRPIDGAGVSKIGQETIAILRRLLDTVKGQLVFQNSITHDEVFNTTILHSIELQIKLCLNLIEKWMKQPNVTLPLTSMLQWGNSSMTSPTPVRDLRHLLQTMRPFLSDYQLAHLSIIDNILHFLSEALKVAGQPDGLQSEHFSPLLEIVWRAVHNLTTVTSPLPQQDILEIVQWLLKLIVQPDRSFASPRNISLLILKKAESVIKKVVPEMAANYLSYAVRIITTYFECISESGGPDNWNHLILKEMAIVRSILPPNSTEQTYLAVLTNIAHFIMESGQGNMSLWEIFENASEENLQEIIAKIGKLLRILWPLVMKGTGSHSTVLPLEDLTHLFQVLDQLTTGKADQDTWDKLRLILEATLSLLEGTEQWNSFLYHIHLVKNCLNSMVKNMQAENAMIQSLQMPLMTLMRQIVQSVNASHFVLSEVSKRMHFAIERTVQAAQQANGTLECNEVVKVWEPVREAAGLSHAALAMWCNISLQPVLEAHAAAQIVCSHLNMSHMGVGPINVSAVAAKIVMIVQPLYQVNINRTQVMKQFIVTFCQFAALSGQPLSPEAQHYLYKQLQDMQLQNSLTSIHVLFKQLLNVAPFLQPYDDCFKKTLSHVKDNYHLIQDGSSSPKLFKEVAMMFLTCANITSHDTFPMMYGNSSGLNGPALTDMMREAVKLMIKMKILGDEPMVHRALEKLLESSDASLIVEKVAEMSVWLAATQASGLDLLSQALPKIHDIFRPLLSVLTEMCTGKPGNVEVFEDLAGNLIAMLRHLLGTSGLFGPHGKQLGMFQSEMAGGYHKMSSRRKRDTSVMKPRGPMDDFIDLLYIDYPSMFRAIAVPPTEAEIWETAHVFLANPDLNVVMKGVMKDALWDLNASEKEGIDAALGMLSFLTLPGIFQEPLIDLLTYMGGTLPHGFPFSSVIKNITRALASESQENLILIEKFIQTAAELLKTTPLSKLPEKLGRLKSQVCTLERMESVRQLMWALSIEPGQLCHTFLPWMQNLAESLLMNTTSLPDTMIQTLIGDPDSYNVQTNWTSVLTQGLGFNISSLSYMNISITSTGMVTFGDMLRNKAAFVQDVQNHTDFDPVALYLLLETPLPNSNLKILSWLIKLHDCNSKASMKMKQTGGDIFKIFCSLSAKQWYEFSLLTARHVNVEKVIYRTVLSDDMQNLVAIMLQAASFITDAMDNLLPAIHQLQRIVLSLKELNLADNAEFRKMSRGQTANTPRQATFVTLARGLCSHGIMALFGISQLPATSMSNISFPNNQYREEMIERFKIPRNATPFCVNMYLDMVNTTGGAIAWAFLKPMLMGHILYTPDTPTTRAIMEKANATLQEFATLRKHSEEWLESSKYIVESAKILRHTLPMLQNSLDNSFVKNFIEMQTDINVGKMKETLSSFSNMTSMLEKNKQILNQITTLSTLMENLSSCVKFDRYRGYDSADQLNDVAQELAKNRELYASVIFKLPKDADLSKGRETRSTSSSTSSLPPKVSYTIRMHMDNVMRSDRVRNPYYSKETHMWASQTMRYNRGFIYLQENIDRAIIEIQTGQKVTEPAVQLQPFPYPCHLRDEYLEAISFVFPLILMIAWTLFVADFVKKLVHERELRLHEYMKMMGVDPLSHFFAWFLECAAYLVLTIFILTLVLKYGRILPNSDGFLIFLYFCDYGLSILAFSYLISSFFDKTYIAGLSGSLLYILCFFPFIIVMALESTLTFSQKSLLSLFSPTCFSYASQYASRYESQGEGIQWRNSYISPIAEDTCSFGWLCWLMLIDAILYFMLGAYIRMVFPGKYGIPAPWYFPFKRSFWADLCCCIQSKSNVNKGLLFTNIMQENQPVFSNDKGKGKSTLSSQAGEDFSELPVGVALHGLSKIYGDQVAVENLNVSFYEGHVTSLLGHNGAGKTTTMSLLTGLFAPSSGTIEVYGRDMHTHIDSIRKELGVCMQYDVLFDHMTSKEHLLLYGQIKAPHWSRGELHEQVRTILEETDMYAHRHKRVGALSGGMKRKLSISIAFIGGSRLVVLDEPTTGVDPCSRRNIWDVVIQHKKRRTIIMSTHHLDEAEVLSDRIAFLERGGLKCCGSPFHLKDKLGQGYKLTFTKKRQNSESEQIDDAELKAFIQAHVPEARLKEAQGGDLVYSLPPFTSSNASSYRSLLTALDSNLDALQLGGYGISDTTLEEVFLQMTHDSAEAEDRPLSISETVSDTGSIDSFPSDHGEGSSNFGDKLKLASSSTVQGMALAWQQMAAILIKRFHHSRRNWKGLISQVLLPVLFVVCAMGLGSIRNDLWHYPELELSPALYNIGPSNSFFSNQNPSSNHLVDTMMSFPGIDNACLDKPDNLVCTRTTNNWSSKGNSSKGFSICKCTPKEEICDRDNYQPPHTKIPSSQILYNLSGIGVENYLVATSYDFIRNRYGGFAFGMPLPPDLQMDIKEVPKNRTLSKVWFNPEGHHTMPAYLNSLNNFILRSNLPADKNPHEYAISLSSHPYFGRRDDEDAIIQGMLQIIVAICVVTGYSITTASFAIYEVNEHRSGFKRLQHIAGISEPFYWAVNFFYDMAIYLIPVFLSIGVVAAFQIPAFTDRQNLAATAFTLVLFGFATFPWMYLLAGIFKDAEMAFITYVCINLFISVNTIISTSIFSFMSQMSRINPEVIQDIFKRLCNAFLIFPQFNFGNSLMQLARMNIEVQILSGYGIDAYKNPFSMDALGRMMISSFIQGLIFFTLRLLLNKYVMRKVRHLIWGRKTMPQVSCEDEDEDVVAEHRRVSSGAANSDILQVNQLTKVYQHLKKKVYAVKSLSVGIPAGECFGLLGENGAGKTTTFQMLTGDVSPTDGTAQIRDWDGRLVDIMECRNEGINIGYCPQVDALDSLLTGEEHLYFYARIRGISKRQIDVVVNYLLKRLELNYHRNIITDGYSCGTRRKLSTALSLIGHPQILLLDEPSSGMDPRTKRHLWKIISEEVKGKCAVVLTSHSMEECEALCSRLAIMVKGQFRCLGSLQHIKNRFGSGFTVKMYLAEASCDAEAITGFMQSRFPSTYLKDHHSTMVEYHVPVAPGGVADIFNQLESNKNALQIKHFSVSQTTLDEVFINFAMGKIGTDTTPDECNDLDAVDAVQT